MSCVYLSCKCKYDDGGHCTFAEWSGSPQPYNAPCFVCVEKAEWKPIKMNPHMLKCSNCSFMVNKNTVYDYTVKDSLVFKYCPNCGADMDAEGSET